MTRGNNQKDSLTGPEAQTQGASLEAPTQEEVKQDLESKSPEDFTKGRGFVDIKVYAAKDKVAVIPYPMLALKALGLTQADADKISKALPPDSLELFFPKSKATTEQQADAEANTEVSNRLKGRRMGRRIGKVITFKLPKPIQRGDTEGKKQQYVSTRIPSTVPIMGVGILQQAFNAITGNGDVIKNIYGPSRRVEYDVPVDKATADKMIAQLAKTS